MRVPSLPLARVGRGLALSGLAAGLRDSFSNSAKVTIAGLFQLLKEKKNLEMRGVYIDERDFDDLCRSS